MPGQIVVRPGGVAHTPVRHSAFRVELECLLEAFDCLAMVEPEHPVEAPVEPDLRVRRGRGDFPAVRPEIKIGHVIAPHSIARPKSSSISYTPAADSLRAGSTRLGSGWPRARARTALAAGWPFGIGKHE